MKNLHFNRRHYLAETEKGKQTKVMQQLKVKDSVAVREPLTGSEVSVSCFLLQASVTSSDSAGPASVKCQSLVHETFPLQGMVRTLYLNLRTKAQN